MIGIIALVARGGDEPVASVAAAEPVIPAIKCPSRVECGHLARQPVDLGLRDVGRVAQDQIESPTTSLRVGKVTLNKTRAVIKAKSRGIPGGHPHRAGADINADAAGLRQLRQTGEKQRPGPAAKVKKA